MPAPQQLQAKSPAAESSPKLTLAGCLRSLRAFSFPLSVLPPLVATAACLPLKAWPAGLVLACTAAAVLLHAAANMINDYFDFRSGVDSRREGNDRRPGLALVRGLLAPRHILIEAGVCLVLAALAGSYVVAVRGPGVVAFAAFGAFALYGYTGAPFVFKYRAMGEPAIFLAFGPALMAAVALGVSGGIPLIVWVLSLPVGLATTAVVTGNNLRDLEEDQAAGVRTLLQRLGRRGPWVYVGLVTGAVAALVLGAALSLLPRPLLAAPAALLLLITPIRCVLTRRRLENIDVHTAHFAGVLDTGILLSLLLK